MDRITAYHALFGSSPSDATQEHVDRLKDSVALTDAELGSLDSDLVDRINSFLDDPDAYVDEETDVGRSALLKAIAGKTSFTKIVPPVRVAPLTSAPETKDGVPASDGGRPAPPVRKRPGEDRPERSERGDRPAREGRDRDGNGREDRPGRQEGGRKERAEQRSSHPCEVEITIRIGGRTPEEVEQLTASLLSRLHQSPVTIEIPAAPVTAIPEPQQPPADPAWNAIRVTFDPLFAKRDEGDADVTTEILALRDSMKADPLYEKLRNYCDHRFAGAQNINDPFFVRHFGPPPVP